MLSEGSLGALHAPPKASPSLPPSTLKKTPNGIFFNVSVGEKMQLSLVKKSVEKAPVFQAFKLYPEILICFFKIIDLGVLLLPLRLRSV